MLNKCYGGFGFSRAFWLRYYKEVKNVDLFGYAPEYTYGDSTKYVKVDLNDPNNDIKLIFYFTKDKGGIVSEDVINFDEDYATTDARELREDKDAIRIFEENPELYNDWAAKIIVVDIPDGMEYTISDYDGIETLRPANIQEW